MSEGAVSRRRFIATGAAAGAAGAAGALSSAEAAPARTRTRVADVVIVGAGFAGLTAARELVRRGKSVIVLEARNRVGGRAVNFKLPGGAITERGATFLGPTQNHIAALARDFKVPTAPVYNTGDNVYVADGSRSTYAADGPTGTAPLDPQILPDLAKLVMQLDQMATEVPVDAPWKTPRAAEYDGQTLETFINANSTNERFRRLTATATRPIFGAEPRDLSLLFVLFYIAASGDESHAGTFERNFNTAGGAQESRFVGGSQLICERLAKQLGRRVLLKQPVRRIVHTRAGVNVHTDGLVVQCRQVIVAIPPTLAGRIDYRPILPFERDQLTQRLAQGALTKVTAVYPTPFWRAKGLTGTAVSLDGFVSATFDDSDPTGTPGIVFGFVGGDQARRFSRTSAAARKSEVLNQFAKFFGSEALRPTSYIETAWANEEWTRGCPVGLAGPGTLLAYGDRLRKPVGRIHWAGTETSTYWNGYMDGAVRSGERAAKEVLAAL